jgi:glycosyltransferase involved in cell wall biosynthesis
MPLLRWRSALKGFAMVKVSIIVPVHNSENYLHKCVESLLAQTLQEIEIILVDDCSTDASRDMIRRYVSLVPEKVRGVFLDQNIRQGGARNRGMDIARGEYIGFVDSDDFVEPDMCRALYEAAQGADLCGADYYLDFDGRLEDVNTDYGEGWRMSPRRRERFLPRCGYFWSRIYRREFLIKHQLRFPENTFYEDAYFNFLTALYAQSLVKAEGRFYHYYQSENSTMRRRNDPKQYERLNIPRLIMGECQARGLYDSHRELVRRKYMSMQMSNITYTCLDQFDTPDREKLGQIKAAIKADCPKYRQYRGYKKESLRLRIYLRLTMLSPRLTVLVYKADRLVELLEVLARKLKRRKRK